MPDAIFEHPRLAAVYDALDPERSDLDGCAALAAEPGAHRGVDIGAAPARPRWIHGDARRLPGLTPAWRR